MNESKIFDQPLYYRHLVPAGSNDFRPYIVGYEKCSPKKEVVFSEKDCYLIHFIIQGDGYLSRGDNVTLLHQGDSFFLEPNSKARYWPSSTNPWSYVWFEVYGDAIAKMLAKTEFTKNNGYCSLAQADVVEKMLESVFDNSCIYHNENSEALRVTGILLTLLGIIVNDNPYEEPTNLSKKETQMHQIQKFIDQNYWRHELTVTSIASHFYFSPNYLTRIFKQSVGTSPIEYIIELRMKKALEYLISKGFSVAQTASALGYKNQFYFSREFTKYYGVPPIEYRKMKHPKGPRHA
jgi:AraC-like DNA-binding protein